MAEQARVQQRGGKLGRFLSSVATMMSAGRVGTLAEHAQLAFLRRGLTYRRGRPMAGFGRRSRQRHADGYKLHSRTILTSKANLGTRTCCICLDQRGLMGHVEPRVADWVEYNTLDRSYRRFVCDLHKRADGVQTEALP